jgi:hypothetical protein
MGNPPSGVLRAFFWEAVVFGAIVGFLFLGYVCHKPALIGYHRLADRSAVNGMQHYGVEEGQRNRFERCAVRHQRHQKALIRLGYLEVRAFRTKYMGRNSPQVENLCAEFRRQCPDVTYRIGWRSENEATEPSCFEITDRPGRMPIWGTLVRKYDIPTVQTQEAIP